MANFTCPSCMRSTDYRYEKPKFCPACGRRPEEAYSAPPRQVQAAAPQQGYSTPQGYPPVPPQQNYYPPIQTPYPHQPVQFPPPTYDYDENYIHPGQIEQGKNYWRQRLNPDSVHAEQRPQRGLKLAEVAAMNHAPGHQDNRTAEQVMAELAKENGSVKSAPISLRDTSNDVPQVIGK